MDTSHGAITRHTFTVSEYHRMAECGVLAQEARVELINGEIIDMAPQGSAHASIISALHAQLAATVSAAAQIRCQMPISLDERSEPEPDLAVVKPRFDFYRRAHPGSHEVLLLIEVADRSFSYDRIVKAQLYAKHAIPELWIIDIAAREIHRLGSPRPEGYARCLISAPEDEIALPAPLQAYLDLSRIL